MPILSYVQQTELEKAQKQQQQLLFSACERGDLEAVIRIVNANKEANAQWNSLNGHPESKNDIKWLLDAQCDTSWTPIMFSARYGHLEIVKYLAKQGAQIEHSTTYYNSLHTACFG